MRKSRQNPLVVLLSLLFLSFPILGQTSPSSFYTEARFLYWKTQVNGLSYALETSSSIATLAGQKVINPSFKWGPGFCVDLGYRIPHDNWKLVLGATLYKNNCTTDLLATDNRQFFAAWNPVFSEESTLFYQVNQHYRLHLGLVDLLLSKPLVISPRLNLTPYLGLSFVSVRQKYHLFYSQPVTVEDHSVIWRMKNKFWGLGPSFGSSCNIEIGKGFSLFAKGALALVYGEFYIHQGQELEKPHTYCLNGFNDFYSVASWISGTGGIRWQTYGLEKRTSWLVELACDQMVLFSQNQLAYFVDNSSPGKVVINQGDLSLMGVQLSVGFSF